MDMVFATGKPLSVHHEIKRQHVYEPKSVKLAAGQSAHIEGWFTTPDADNRWKFFWIERGIMINVSIESIKYVSRIFQYSFYAKNEGDTLYPDPRAIGMKPIPWGREVARIFYNDSNFKNRLDSSFETVSKLPFTGDPHEFELWSNAPVYFDVWEATGRNPKVFELPYSEITSPTFEFDHPELIQASFMQRLLNFNMIQVPVKGFTDADSEHLSALFNARLAKLTPDRSMCVLTSVWIKYVAFRNIVTSLQASFPKEWDTELDLSSVGRKDVADLLTKGGLVFLSAESDVGRDLAYAMGDQGLVIQNCDKLDTDVVGEILETAMEVGHRIIILIGDQRIAKLSQTHVPTSIAMAQLGGVSVIPDVFSKFETDIIGMRFRSIEGPAKRRIVLVLDPRTVGNIFSTKMHSIYTTSDHDSVQRLCKRRPNPTSFRARASGSDTFGNTWSKNDIVHVELRGKSEYRCTNGIRLTIEKFHAYFVVFQACHIDILPPGAFPAVVFFGTPDTTHIDLLRAYDCCTYAFACVNIAEPKLARWLPRSLPIVVDEATADGL